MTRKNRRRIARWLKRWCVSWVLIRGKIKPIYREYVIYLIMARMHKHYQHVATAQKRQAVESLPELDVTAVSCAMNHVPGNLTRVLQ